MFGYRFNKSIILADKIDAKKGTKAISFLFCFLYLLLRDIEFYMYINSRLLDIYKYFLEKNVEKRQCFSTKNNGMRERAGICFFYQQKR